MNTDEFWGNNFGIQGAYLYFFVDLSESSSRRYSLPYSSKMASLPNASISQRGVSAQWARCRGDFSVWDSVLTANMEDLLPAF